MHSQLALTEHVSLNLALLILLDPVHYNWEVRFTKFGDQLKLDLEEFL